MKVAATILCLALFFSIPVYAEEEIHEKLPFEKEALRRCMNAAINPELIHPGGYITFYSHLMKNTVDERLVYDGLKDNQIVIHQEVISINDKGEVTSTNADKPISIMLDNNKQAVYGWLRLTVVDTDGNLKAESINAK